MLCQRTEVIATNQRTAARRFSDAEMDIAKGTDLPDLLDHLGYHVRRVGSYHTTKEMDSLRIKNRRTWHRYSNNHAGDAITFLQEFCNKSFPEAVEYLLAYHGRARDSPAPPAVASSAPKEKIPFALPPPCEDSRRVFAYLKKRGIAPQVIRGFLGAGLLYEDAKYHNCVFVGLDKDGVPKYAGKRGTYDRDGPGFKGDVSSSDKDIAFRLPCAPDIDWVFVFEAPIDLMSYCTLHRSITSNAVALCGVYEGPLDTYLQDYPHLRRIALCLDADGPGQEATERLRAKYEEKGYVVAARAPPRGKDWNEYLQQKIQARERGR